MVTLAKSQILNVDPSAQNVLTRIELHNSRVKSVWERHKPEWVMKQTTSLGHVLVRTIAMGGTLYSDGDLGMFLSSGMSIGIVPHRQILCDYAPDDMPSVGAYGDGTPFLGQICWARPTGDNYCHMPVERGVPTCTHMTDPVIMGTPIPVEWSMHS